jgi:hypothetical protein
LPFEGDQSYYVTDNLISTGGDLSDYPELEIAPLSIEVIPHYLGAERFGNVILKVSGSASSKEIPLWSDFDKSAQTQTVRLELADILRLSGIKENTEQLETSLMLGEKPYQEEVLKFEVMRPSAPGKPFKSAKELPVKNAPWKQEVSLTYRDELVLDYALTNFGGTARFSCDITVARTLADVSSYDHSFWSGAEGFSYVPDCEPFTLKTGETYQTSFPLNEETLGQEFPHGRYLIEVYSFAERKDILLKDGSSFDNYDDRWLYSNDGNIETFIICNDPGESCEETDTLPVEEEAIRVFPFSSEADPQFANGATNLMVRSRQVNNRLANQYILEYSFDPERDGWAGFEVWFEDSVDVSMYNSIRFRLILDDSLHPLWLDVKNKIGDEYKLSRVAIGDGTYGEPSSEEQTIVVPFDAFDGIDWAAVATLDFVIDSFWLPDSGWHEIRVSEIEFIR